MSQKRIPALPDGSRFVMPVAITLMVAIAAVFYFQTAKDDVDRYPSCFVANCSLVN
jgi:hypothetical protein